MNAGAEDRGLFHFGHGCLSVQAKDRREQDPESCGLPRPAGG